jgi:acyl-CoA thioesterase
MMNFDQLVALEPTGRNAWTAHAHPACEANTGMFGGWTAAAMLRAALSCEGAEGTPAAMTATFVSRVEPGAIVAIRAQRLGGGKSLKSWRAEIASGAGELNATASIVTANRRDSDRFLEGAMPTATAPDEIPLAHPPGNFGATIDMRPVAGFPPFRRADTHSLAWVRVMSSGPLDWTRLVYLADATPPRVFYISDGPRPSSTITMSVYFYASDAELAAVGEDHILSEVSGVRAEGSISGLTMRLWSRQGALLATSEQLCWFR